MGGVKKTTNVIGNYVFPSIHTENEYIKSGGATHFKDSDGNIIYKLYYDETEDAMYWEHVPTGAKMRMV